jgi:CheY-specific phosphatase CheX
MDEIATVIDNDHALTGPLMQRAYPRAPVRHAATIQMATSRVGINYILILLMTDLLTQYVLATFQEMAAISLTKDDPSLIPLDQRSHLVASVKFKGKANGTVYFVFTSAMSLLVADRVLGAGVELTLETNDEAVIQITSEIARNLERGLCAGRLPCTVETPEITLGEMQRPAPVPNGTHEEFYFRYSGHGLHVHLCVSPFSLG